MSKTFKTEAIILRKRSLPNADKIITLFTQEIGKVNVFAKGIKKITSRRLPHAQSANLITCIIHQKDDRLYLAETSLISGFSQIKKNRIKMNTLYLFFFVMERLLPEHQKEPAVYNLVKRFLIDVSDSRERSDELLQSYTNRALRLLGYSHEEKSFSQLTSFIEEIIHEKIPDIHI